MRQASTIIIGDVALIGLKINDGNDFQAVQRQVSAAVAEGFPALNSVYTTSDPDLFSQISAASEKIAQNQPTDEPEFDSD